MQNITDETVAAMQASITSTTKIIADMHTELSKPFVTRICRLDPAIAKSLLSFVTTVSSMAAHHGACAVLFEQLLVLKTHPDRRGFKETVHTAVAALHGTSALRTVVSNVLSVVDDDVSVAAPPPIAAAVIAGAEETTTTDLKDAAVAAAPQAMPQGQANLFSAFNMAASAGSAASTVAAASVAAAVVGPPAKKGRKK